MSSPPAPASSTLPNPRKRPAMTSHSTASQSAMKRPKLHPLRQTSFPAETSTTGFHATPTPTARSETGSLASGFSHKPAGRRRKNRAIKREHERSSTLGLEDDDPRTIGPAPATTTGAESIITHSSGAAATPRAMDDDEDLFDTNATMDEESLARAAEEAKQEAAKVDRLTSTFTPEQDRRYHLYRAVKLNKNTVRKIVNQTVSQSVTAMPLLAVNVYSKFFVGEIVERARDVQAQWAQAWDEDTVDQNGRRIPNPHAGGLLPDHLREALRRYKASGEGAGVGFGSLSHPLIGVHGSAAWRGVSAGGGGRLFK